MACTCGKTNTATTISTVKTNSITTISAVHPDIIQTHILTCLDGPSLASAASTCSQLHALSGKDHLWANICHSTWPSTITPRVRHVISTFPCASRSFFADSFPAATATAQNSHHANPDRTPELIFSVDLFHRRKLILSRVLETETESGWFRCSPFRVDLLDPKDTVKTGMEYPRDEDVCRNVFEDLTLSWIVIDPRGRRAVNLSSRKPVSVQRHWLSGEVQVRFATVMGGGERGSASEMALCNLMVTCGGEMQVREVSLQMEDMDGMHLNGRDSLGILQRALEGKRGRLKREEKNGYVEFLNMKKERKERKLRDERRLDMLCIALAALSFLALSHFFLF
ncbi:probable F-box protein At2g36090 [Gastrolobium bilobum]|uniref:probable F-box protein At2g36090 n=1 Tax=Gastrolobium bilobum TaxID=150636 RepID=UPI002AAFFF1D|nr:probable F-box protein At2g36090 [Gastrolobium bilobum]